MGHARLGNVWCLQRKGDTDRMMVLWADWQFPIGEYRVLSFQMQQQFNGKTMSKCDPDAHLILQMDGRDRTMLEPAT